MSRGGRGPRVKGFGFEREVVKLALEAGMDKAKRMWGSNGRAQGYPEGVDIVFQHRDAEWRWQAKRYAHIAEYLKRPDGTDGVIIREDHGEPLIVVPLAAFLKLAIGDVAHGRENVGTQQGTVFEVSAAESVTPVAYEGDGGTQHHD